MLRKNNNLSALTNTLVVLSYLIIKATKKDSGLSLVTFYAEYISAKKELQNLNVSN